MTKKNNSLKNIKSISSGYLITVFIGLGAMIVNLTLHWGFKLVSYLTHNELEALPSWFMGGINLISGVFGLLTLFTILAVQFFEIIRLVRQKLKNGKK